MKLPLVIVGLLLAAFSAHADSILKIDGSAQTVLALLRGEVTHTEYRTETVAYTCYHREQDGFDTVCETVGGGEECGITPEGRRCFPVPGHQECSTVPRYVDVADTCYREEQVPYLVKDFDVENDITVLVPASDIVGLDESLLIAQHGELASLQKLQTSKKALIYTATQSEVISFDGHLKKMKTAIHVSLFDLVEAANPLIVGMGPLMIENDRYLMFTLGKVIHPSLLSFSADIRRNRFFGIFGSEKYLQRKLAEKEFAIEDAGQGLSRVKIDLAGLGVSDKIKGRKIKFTVTTDLTIDRNGLVNESDIAKSKASKKLKQKMGK